MSSLSVALLIVLAAANLALLIVLFFRRPRINETALRAQFDLVIGEARRLEQSLRDEFGRLREESGRGATSLRTEVETRINSGMETLLQRQAEARQSTEGKLETFRGTLESKLREFGEHADARSSRRRQEQNESLSRVAEALNNQFEKLRAALDAKLGDLQAKNEQKLEEMRRTVDEKLEGTLERRLGESFKLVSERLDLVHKGLGEMQAMASNVGDLKRVLTNVKVRGTWGEVQLGMLLEQVLTPDQYDSNARPNPDSDERVEFALRLPGSKDSPVLLPIDAKFPLEDYQRLCEASERADIEGVTTAGKALEIRLRAQAKDIRDKYIAPPHTTDFAILFLASEGLYAEAIRRPGLADGLQRDYRVVVAGPTTLTAILNSLQMGFRTLALQERSSEVWKVLGAVKTEFGRFGEVIAKVKKKLDEASSHIEQTEVRTRAIGRKLREVEGLPADQAAQLLPDVSAEVDETNGETEAPEKVDLGELAETQRRLGL
ncbi:MAG: DNA recombination protein RmuC [Verrucomicrobia subdivision 3 bacterium]|nr:DNA recombination protein RmuC [Limisphaerales bacterium]